jgi:hypothetical protein
MGGIGFQRRDLLPRRRVFVAGNAADEARFKTMIASAQVEAEARAKVAADADKKADAKIKQFISAFPPPYNLIAGAFYGAFRAIGSMMGKDYDSQEYQDRARQLMLRFMRYGRPAPASVGFDVQSWATYGDLLEKIIAIFDALPKAERDAMLWLGQKLEAYGGNKDVLSMISAGDEWYFSALPSAAPDAGGAYPYCSAKPWEPMLAGTVAGLAANQGNPSDDQKKEVLHATVKAWAEFPVPAVKYEEGTAQAKVTQPDGTLSVHYQRCVRDDGTQYQGAWNPGPDLELAIKRWAATAVAAKKASEDAGNVFLMLRPGIFAPGSSSAPLSTPAKVAVGTGAALGLFVLAKWVLIPLLA